MSEEVIRYWEENAGRYRDEAYKFKTGSSRYPFYETRLALIDDMTRALPSGRLLDAGCGGGSVLLHYLGAGWDGQGVDGAEAMVALARENLAAAGHEEARVNHSSVTDLGRFEDGTFDLIVSAGVMEYLTPEEEAEAFAEARRVLKPGGHKIVENINGLFDISTFNRFTANFFGDQVLPLFFDDADRRAELGERIKGLMTNPDKPDRSGTFSTTRDQVFTKAEIPLAYGDKVAGYGFRQVEQGFYRYHAVPPLLFAQEPALEQVPIEKELALSRHWIGTFLASGFVSLLTRD